MSRINEKLGLKPAGQRAMMKDLPTDRATRAQVTAAICPLCHRRTAKVSRLTAGALYCRTCGHTWPLEAVTP
jgi:ribosomal protein L37AE/L43A